MKIVLLGAPGSGKGTQAERIKNHFSLTHVSTGDIFRENIRNKTELGIKVKAIMDSGRFCPDDVTVELVKDRLSKPDCQDNYLLDGFPRNLFQAQELDGFSAPDKVINLVVDFDKIEKRITGRRVCSKCNASYHVSFIGETKTCSACGGELVIRKDDTPETVKERFAIYNEQTAPLIGYYEKQGKLINIDGDKDIEEIFNDIIKVLG